MSNHPDSLLRHGSSQERALSSPVIGQRFETPLLSIQQFPEQPFEINFKSDEDVVSIAFGHCIGLKAYDTDRRTRLFETPGTAYFHPAGSEIYVLAEQSSELLCFSFPKTIRQEFLSDQKNSVYQDLTRTIEDINSPFIAALANVIRDVLATDPSHGSLEGEALALRFFDHLLHTAGLPQSPAHRPGLDKRKLQRVLEFIEANLDQQLSLGQLAQVASLQLNHFVRAFKQATHQTPHRYVLHRRLARAKQLLKASDLPIAEVAYSLGFSSQAHFTTAFGNHARVTPHAYRRGLHRISA